MIFEDILLITLLGSAALADYRFRKVPNLLTLPAGLAGMFMGAANGGFMGLGGSVSGLIAGIALLSIPYAMGGMGAGDVKLLGAVGAIKGPYFVFMAFLAAAIIGGIMAVIKSAFIMKSQDMRLLSDSIRAVSYSGSLSSVEIPGYVLKEKLPYAIAIAAGGIIAIFMEGQWL